MVGGDILLGVCLEVSKAHARPSFLSLPGDQDVAISYSFSTMSACLHAPCHDYNGLSL